MENDDIIDLKRLYKIMLRQKIVIASCIAILTLLALLYVLFATPQYTAKSLILLDRSVTQAVSDISAVKQVSFEGAALESEVEVLKSRRVATAAVNALGGVSYFSDNEDKTLDDVINELNSRLNVSRVGETYVLSIQYTAENPEKAAEIANAYAEAYISDQLAAMSEMSEKTISWLQEKIDEIRTKSIEAEEKVADYRLQLNQRQQTGGQAADDNVEANLSVLRNLEKEAETYENLYDSYLENLETINTQQSFPVTETRVITSAVAPNHKSHPRSKLILGAAIILGAGFGIVLAILIENFDKTLRRAGQVRRELGQTFLGFLPQQDEAKRQNLDFMTQGKITAKLPFATQSIDHPASLYSETIRSIRNAFDMHPGAKVIGISAVDDNKGKSLVAENLAFFLSQSSHCIYIDADMNEPTKTAGKTAESLDGLGDILVGNTTLDQTLLHYDQSKLSVLPSFSTGMEKTLAYVNVGKATEIIEACKAQADYVVVNMPQLIAPADFYSFAQSVDQFVFAAEWGKSLSNAINFHLSHNGVQKDHVLGVVLENADMKKMKKHYGHKANA